MDVYSDSLVIVARIIKPHGIRGEVILESLSDVEGRLDRSKKFTLLKDGRALRELHVESGRFFNGRYALKFREISSLNEAELLRGNELAIPEDQLGALPEGKYFIHQLIGMTIQLMDGRDVGRVKNVMKTGGVDILEVGEKGEILIPFTSDICVEVNPDLKLITIDPPEGLLQLNAN
jgi:16S rRNA processing protein RimM